MYRRRLQNRVAATKAKPRVGRQPPEDDMRVEQQLARARRSAIPGNESSKVSAIRTRPRSAPGYRIGDARSGTSRATRLLPRRRTISSPASTRRTSSESRVLASPMGIASDIVRP
jgi:hypothetical protein